MQYVSKTGSKDQEEQATSVIIARASFSYLFLYLNLLRLCLQIPDGALSLHWSFAGLDWLACCYESRVSFISACTSYAGRRLIACKWAVCLSDFA